MPPPEKARMTRLSLLFVAYGLARLEAVSAARVGLRDRRVDRTSGAAAERQQPQYNP